MNWNVIVTVREPHYRAAPPLLRQFGEVGKTHYHDVLVMTVDDPRSFLDRLHTRAAEEPAIREWLGHVAPFTEVFSFQSVADFEQRCGEVARRFLPQLAGKRFHVRMHRRGFKGQMHATQEEQSLDGLLLQALAEAGAPGEITFDDPDAIVALETVDTRAGAALWTREDLQKYFLLHLD